MNRALFPLIAALLLAGCSWIPKEKDGTEGQTTVIPTFAFRTVFTEARAGDADAQYKLGEMYRGGQGVALNYAEAYAWYMIAAENGHLTAKARLRADWRQVNINRGKELYEILTDRYPDAVLPEIVEPDCPPCP